MSLHSFVSQLREHNKRLFFILLDLVVGPLALVATLLLLNTFKTSLETSFYLPLMIGLSAVLNAIVADVLGLHHMRLNAYESSGIQRSGIAAVIIAFACSAVSTAVGMDVTLSFFTLFAMTLLVGSAMSRIVLRQLVIWIYRSAASHTKLIIYGAGQTGLQLAAALRTGNETEIVAFVDDNPKLQGLSMMGIHVHPPKHIETLIESRGINRVVLAMPSAAPSIQTGIARRLRTLGCDVHALPSFADLVSDHDLSKRYNPVPLDQLLGRNDLGKDLPEAASAYRDTVVLITGAGGSIGSELCRQLVECKPAHLVLLDHCELALYKVDKELRTRAPHLEITPVLGSVCNREQIQDILQEHQIETVLHAAAYKHVPMVERNEIAGLNNNVLGTKTIADAALAAGVKRFILVSSDKAVRPTNIMGASKRLAEMVVQDLATRSTSTMFSMVRFGNVLGSSGSVIPLFEEQIARGGPVTLTHNKVARYFMTLSEAARLVLLAGTFARGGDVFVLDMGDLIPIRKLARQMIEGSGLSVRDAANPNGDIEIQITGLRPGEKLIEELLISPDMLTTPHSKILRAQEKCPSEFEVATVMKDLRQIITDNDRAMARDLVTLWVEKQPQKEAQTAT